MRARALGWDGAQRHTTKILSVCRWACFAYARHFACPARVSRVTSVGVAVT